MLTPINAPPEFIARDVAESTTPASFAGGPEVLVFDGDAALRVDPVPQFIGTADASMHGHLWLSEQHLVFSGGGTTFMIDYPSIALHAVSRAVPAELGAHEACLYCQIDDHADDDSEDEMHELWIAVADSERAYTLTSGTCV